MLPQNRRLKKENDIRRVFKEGQTFKSAPLSLKAAANDLGRSRFGFAVPLRVTKKATSRNKIKRRMSETIRLQLPIIKKGFDVMILVFPGADKLSFQELKGTLENLFQKAKLYD
ncbi:MAG: ribonuclease P protein component [bacterium]|nr:ribonuclease P protein component [bacterium]